MVENIRCSNCRFVQPDLKMSSKHWIAYECGNSNSNYWGYLLNINKNGDKLSRITWSGCEYGELKERDEKYDR